MKTVVRIAFALASMGLGCSQPPKTTAPPPDTSTAVAPATPQAPVARESKTAAPADVTFTASSTSGEVVLTLGVTALADIPQAVARVVVPKELTVTGAREVDLGTLAKGATRELKVTVQVPKGGHYQVFAGVDCRLTAGIQLHKSATAITLGE